MRRGGEVALLPTARQEIAWAMFCEFWSRPGGHSLSPAAMRTAFDALTHGAMRSWLARADAAIDCTLRVTRRCEGLADLEKALLEGRP